jgi:two-component system LytT family response regulator
LNSIIVDDEFPSREELKYFMKNFSKIEIVKEFEDPMEALNFLQENYVEVIFLDINMPNLNGMNFAKIISKFSKKPKIVFITAYDNYAVEAFSIKAFDYILKPYSENRIIDTLKRLESETTLNKTEEKEEKTENIYCSQKITLWQGDKMYVISLDEIYYCEACERETKIFTRNGVYIARHKISELEKKLPKKNFLRTHRSYIVNLDKIKEIVPWFNNTYNLKLQHIDDIVPVSRNNIKTFKEIMDIK